MICNSWKLNFYDLYPALITMFIELIKNFEEALGSNVKMVEN